MPVSETKMRQEPRKSAPATIDYQSVMKEESPGAKPTPATEIGSSASNSRSYKAGASRSRDNIETSFFQVSEVPERKKMQNCQRNSLPASVRSYTMPQLSCAKCYWYISFNAFDPAIGKLRRKRIRISPKFTKVSDRRKYANDLLERITLELRQGWNPWVNYAAPEQYATLQEVIDKYRSYLSKCKAEAILRVKTWKGYTSYLDNFLKWNDQQPVPIHYIYQFDCRLLGRFVDWLWLDKGLSVRTRDNYVGWLRTFCKWLLSHSFVEVDPSAHLQTLGGQGSMKKNRTIIPPDAMMNLKEYCRKNNRHFLLACYILYYCFIRPNEMSYIQLKHISIKRGTIFIPDYSSKNRKDGTVTLPDVVVKLMIELEIFSHPDSYYLFSHQLLPGPERHSSKQFTDYWSHYIRKDLRFPDKWKFYSLKDTGITDLIREHTDLLSVRNQARHHSLLMTDIYTPHDIEEANDVIKSRKAAF